MESEWSLLTLHNTTPEQEQSTVYQMTIKQGAVYKYVMISFISVPNLTNEGQFVPCKVDAHTDVEYIVERLRADDPAEF